VSRVPAIIRGIALLALIAVTAHAIERWTIRPLRCSRAASIGHLAISEAEGSVESERRSVARTVIASLSGCECVTPPNVQIFHTLGAAEVVLGDDRAATAQFERALEVDRRPETYFALAIASLKRFDRPSAVRYFVRACAFDPSRLATIPHDDLRAEVRERLRREYGDWF
jgi:hypothetical protein